MGWQVEPILVLQMSPGGVQAVTGPDTGSLGVLGPLPTAQRPVDVSHAEPPQLAESVHLGPH